MAWACEETFRPFRPQNNIPAPQPIAYPTQLFARRLIDSARHDALSPRSEIAADARAWLSARTDWTLRKLPPPPPEVRGEFIASFEWACRILQEDPQHVRANGLARTFYVGSSQGAETWAKNKP
jgi:hypothetical protein